MRRPRNRHRPYEVYARRVRATNCVAPWVQHRPHRVDPMFRVISRVTFRQMSIEITQKKSSGVERRLAVSVPADQVRDAEEEAARGYASKVRLPGFRPGKAPPAIVRKRFADAIRQQAVEALVREAYEEAIGREQLKLDRPAARSRPEVRAGTTADLRAASRGAAGDQPGSHAGISRSAIGATRHPGSGHRAARGNA